MFVQSKAIANWLIDRAAREGTYLTPMQILKLVYIAHGWHLAEKGRPLVDEPITAWQYGPVIESLYDEFKVFGGGPITRRAMDVEYRPGYGYVPTEPVLSNGSDTAAFLDRVWLGYGHYSGPQLMHLTHQPGTPWTTVWEQYNGRATRNALIPNELIRDYYTAKMREMQNAARPVSEMNFPTTA